MYLAIQQLQASFVQRDRSNEVAPKRYSQGRPKQEGGLAEESGFSWSL